MTFLENLYGSLSSLPWLLTLFGSLALLLGLAFFGAPLLVWTLTIAAWLFGLGAPWWLGAILALPAIVLNLPPLRRAVITAPLMRLMKALKFLPVISDTERAALEAGTVWADGELFSGKPDFERLNSEAYPELDAEEQAFLDGPVEELCRITDDWEVWQNRDLPEPVWDRLRADGFFGLIIPKEYGGHAFSPSANSAVVTKLSSRCTPLAITVMVPNSLGPAELLIHYGTQEQKDYWLPRLASGEEIPSFALTEPNAGSDAGAISARGVVFRGDDGELYLRLDWEKRYISLAAISTVLGLAFKLHDPENLLGKGENPGITCALIPTQTEGVVLGRRHDPLGVPFYNCPTQGKDVVVPIDAIVGGAEYAGQGWKMLMETLAAGRGISLPASGVASAKMTARIAGAYASVRKQFGLSIGKFEGIEEPLARLGGAAYTLEAARRYTCGGLDKGTKPAVVTAIAKYNFTEVARQCINDGMDILGGAAISRGPRNLLAHGYIATPISITVEGANILTRTLMIFGQGAIRCHPYAYAEIQALGAGDVVGFDRAFFGHIGHVVRNGARALLLSLSRGYLARSPVSGPAAPYYRRLAWSSASFAFLADTAMAGLGGDLKRKETVTGRFSDIFSWMYLATATLRRFEAEGRKAEDRPFFEWSMQTAFAHIQAGFDGLYRNLDLPGMGWLLRGPVALWSRLNPIGSSPSDRLGHQVAKALQIPGAQRDALTGGMYLPSEAQEALGRLERAFVLCHEADTIVRKIKQAIRSKQLPKAAPASLVEEAVKQGILSSAEAARLQEAEEARQDAIQVDSFTLEEYMRTAENNSRSGDLVPGAFAGEARNETNAA